MIRFCTKANIDQNEKFYDRLLQLPDREEIQRELTTDIGELASDKRKMTILLPSRNWKWLFVSAEIQIGRKEMSRSDTAENIMYSRIVPR